MRKLDFFRLQAPAAVPAHIGASSLKKSNFLIFSKVLRKGADQANYSGQFFYCITFTYCYLLRGSRTTFIKVSNYLMECILQI